LEKADCGVTEILINDFMIEKGYCVDDVERCPADEKFKDDYEQHLDDSFFVQQTLLGI
jgi:hypothetical protein